MTLYPIRFEPIYQDYVWGGSRIAKKYDRPIGKKKIAESWELSDRKDGMSVVVNGPLKGQTLNQLVQEHGEALLGVGQQFDTFPLLLKIIDAKENLSIQVHPDEQGAAELKGEPKTEMWYLLEEGTVYAGFKNGVTKDTLKKALKNDEVEDLLEKHDLRRGEAVFIPAGRVHSICGGSLLFEVQQNSDTTYRLYDWGRNKRPLHVEEAMTVMSWNEEPQSKVTPHHLESDLHHQIISLVRSPFFVVERMDVFKHLHVAAIPKTFQIFFCIEGEGTLTAQGHTESFKPGMTFLIPASCTGIEIDGKCEMLRVRLP